MEGWAALYTAFLDGTLYQSSHHADKEPFAAEWKAGFAAVLGRIEAGFAYVYRTLGFVGQEKDNGHGSLLVKVRF